MYKITHPCCDQPILVTDDRVVVFSGCDGLEVWSGSREEFLKEFAGRDVWQFDTESAPGYYSPIEVRVLGEKVFAA